jgi:hypothetical protein
VERTWRRVRQLHVEVRAERAVVHGQTLSYYSKQLAIQAVLEALRDAGVTALVDVRISVGAPAQPRPSTCPRPGSIAPRRTTVLPDVARRHAHGRSPRAPEKAAR